MEKHTHSCTLVSLIIMMYKLCAKAEAIYMLCMCDDTVCVYYCICMYVCKDSAAPAHATKRESSNLLRTHVSFLISTANKAQTTEAEYE